LAQNESNWVLCSTLIKMREGETSKLQMPLDIPQKLGINRVYIKEPKLFDFDAYVGGGQGNQDRVKNYQNAGWQAGKIAFTNRIVRGWVHEKL
jgi:hypothetical protein